MRGVYEAQVRERDVPVLGGEYVDTGDSLSGSETKSARVFVAVPWPPSPPWRENPSAVPFVRLDLVRERVMTTPQMEPSTNWRVGLTVSLNREMDAIVRWSRVQPTALDLIHDTGSHDVLEVAYTYAFGR